MILIKLDSTLLEFVYKRQDCSYLKQESASNLSATLAKRVDWLGNFHSLKLQHTFIVATHIHQSHIHNHTTKILLIKLTDFVYPYIIILL